MHPIREDVKAGILNTIENIHKAGGPRIPLFAVPQMGPMLRDPEYIRVAEKYEIPCGEKLQNKVFSGGTRVGLHHYGPHGICSGAVIEDFGIVDTEMWGSRAYRMNGARTRRGYVARVRKEHGFYWNIAGPLATEFSGIYFEEIGGQAIQIVCRNHEQGLGDWTDDNCQAEPLLLADMLARDCGRDDGRAGYAFSIFGAQLQSTDGHTTLATVPLNRSVHARRVLVDNSMQTLPLKAGATCNGAFYFGPGQNLHLENCGAVMGITNRPIMRIEGRSFVRISGGFWQARGGQPNLEFVNCPRIVIEGALGDARVKINGADVGPVWKGVR